MQTPIKLDSFSAVEPGSDANLVIQPGVTYDGIYLETSLAPSEIENARLQLNAEEIWSLSGAELVMLDKFDVIYDSFGGPVYRYSLPIQYETAVLADMQRVTSLTIGPGDNCVLKVKIAAGATSPTLEAFAETSAFRGYRDAIRKFERYTVPVAGAGTAEFFSVNRGSRVLRMHFKTANMDGLEIVRDRLKVYELDKGRNDYLLKRSGRVPQSGYFHFDPTKQGFPVLDGFATVANALTFKLNMTAAGNVPILVERLYKGQAMNWSQGNGASKPPARRRRGLGRG